MFFKRIKVIVILLLTTLYCSAQASFMPVVFTVLTGAEEEESHIYNETSLYGYIDGGAELYLEYGFDTLAVTELKYDGNDIKVEIYRMKDPEAAFGIFSVSRFRCNGGRRLTKHICHSAYQLQFCKGPFYVSIINDTGTNEDQNRSGKIALLILGQIDDSPFNPGEFFAEGLDDETMKGAVLVRGPLGIYNGFPALSEILGETTGYSALAIRKKEETVISVRFVNEESAKLFLQEKNVSNNQNNNSSDRDSDISVLSPDHIIITF